MSGILNPAVEALCSATYLGQYLDAMENLPNDLQRIVSEMRELDALTNDTIQDLENSSKRRTCAQMQRSLIRCQDIGDEKLRLSANVLDKIENHARQLEQALDNLDPGANLLAVEKVEFESSKLSTAPATSQTTTHVTNKPTKVQPEEKVDKIVSTSSSLKRQRRHKPLAEVPEEEKKEDKDRSRKKKKRKLKKEKPSVSDIQDSPMHDPIDPDEETYCSCRQISYGEMICCDNDNCAIEWFHFNCVNLVNKPKGKWYCPQCRGDKSNVRRPDMK